jgi:hypothetical protein
MQAASKMVENDQLKKKEKKPKFTGQTHVA